jgi:hypothetical protein
MDHLGVLREKIGRLRAEIADIQALNEQFRRDGGNGADVQVAHGQRNERLQAIQSELVQLADLGRKSCFYRTNEGKAPLPVASRHAETGFVADSKTHLPLTQ